jgi:hypothetical protein
MCSLFDYIANKLSKDKIVDLSVNIDKHLHKMKQRTASLQFSGTKYFARAQSQELSHLSFGLKHILSHVEMETKFLFLFYFISDLRLCKSKLVFIKAKKS